MPNLFGNGLSSSPSNTPAPQAGADFPPNTTRDNVRAQHALGGSHFGGRRVHRRRRTGTARVPRGS
ncbi:hypothetical protein ACI2L4_39830 [Streptomyces sparsogenes]|uniref:hypothetical protein n=1 Tax=Streptomyces sparsogenes TaxID=67365 RepID=UPI00384F819E